VVRRIPASPNLIEVSVQHLADVDVNVESQVLRVRTGRYKSYTYHSFGLSAELYQQKS